MVASGDCTTSLGVLAGLQRAGRDVAVVTRTTVSGLPDVVPGGDLHVHLDVDVCTPDPARPEHTALVRGVLAAAGRVSAARGGGWSRRPRAAARR